MAIKAIPHLLYLSLIAFCTRNNYMYTRAMQHSTDALQFLYSATEDACGYVDWCVLKTGLPAALDPETATELPHNGCCKPCLCTQHCSTIGTCCPDSKLTLYFNETVFTNATVFFGTLRKAGISPGPTNDDHVRDQNVAQQQNTECFYSQMWDIDRARPRGSVYYMVTRCYNDTVDSWLITKCEEAGRSGLNRELVLMLPVQSVNSGIVYRNKFCHACSDESESAVEPWDVLITQYGSLELVLNSGSSFEVIVTFLETSPSYRKNIPVLVFEPSTAMRLAHAPQPCRVVDVVSCHPDNRQHTQEEAVSCSGFPAPPVFATVNGTDKAFNNLACVQCNGVPFKGGVTGCSLWEADWNKPSTGILALTGEILTRIDNTTASAEEPLAISFSSSCQDGFLYDKHTMSCRKVYCPCGTTPQDSKCTPILREVEGSVEAYLIVSLVSQGENRKKIFKEEVLTYIMSVIESKPFVLNFADLYYTPGIAPVYDYTVHVGYAGRQAGVTFSKLIALTSKSLLGRKTLTSGGEAVTFEMELNDNLNTQWDVRIPRYALMDIVTSNFYDRIASMPSKQLRPKHSLLILKCNFCYRVAVLNNELKRIGPRQFMLTRTRTMVSAQRFHYDLADESVIWCVDQAFGTSKQPIEPNDKSTNPGTEQTERTTHSIMGQGKETDIWKTVAMSATLGSLAIVICLVAIARRYARKFSSSTDVVQDMEIVEIKNEE